MNRSDRLGLGRGVAIFVWWTLIGVLLGIGVAYFLYARETPVFESIATVQVSRDQIRKERESVEPSVPQQKLQIPKADSGLPEGNERISGFRITDDASQDVVLRTPLQEQPATHMLKSGKPQVSSDLQHDAAQQTDENSETFRAAVSADHPQPPDDSYLLCSQAVLARAIELGGLEQIQELQWMVSARDQSPEAYVRTWVSNGTLGVKKSGETSLGGVYQIAFRSRLPSTSERVMRAVADAVVETFDNGSRQQRNAKLLEILTSDSREIDERLKGLEDYLENLPVLPDAIYRDGKVVSPDAVRLSAMVGVFERLQAKQQRLEQNLERAEALLAEGADSRMVWETLGTAVAEGERVGVAEATDAVQRQTGESEPSEAVDEYRKWLELKSDLVEKVDREVAPLQKKLDAFIEKKYGPNHPAVSHLRGQIGRVRAQLSNLPPEPAGIGMFGPEANEVTPGETVVSRIGVKANSSEGGISVEGMLRVTRSELKGVAEKLKQLDGELEMLSTTVARQRKVLKQRASVQLEILQQRELRRELIEHSKLMHERASKSEISCELLVPAGPGVQVAPELQPYLWAGGVLGGASGAVLFFLISLSMSGIAEERESEK